jgi:hypothetical protein
MVFLNASRSPNQLVIRFEPMRIWSTSLRSPVTHAARFNAAICRNQHDSGFQLMKIRVTNLRSPES